MWPTADALALLEGLAREAGVFSPVLQTGFLPGPPHETLAGALRYLAEVVNTSPCSELRAHSRDSPGKLLFFHFSIHDTGRTTTSTEVARLDITEGSGHDQQPYLQMNVWLTPTEAPGAAARARAGAFEVPPATRRAGGGECVIA